MPRSIILHFLSQKLGQSYILKFLSNQVDVDEQFRYQSVITSSLSVPINLTNRLMDLVASKTIFSWISKRLDLKSVVLFLFVSSLVIFSGAGSEDTGVAFLPGSPVNSISHSSGSTLNIIVFLLFLLVLLRVFLKDATKDLHSFVLSKFEILLVIFFVIIEFALTYSLFPTTSLVWLVRVLRGLIVYFIFSRLSLKKRHFLAICCSFLFVIYLESILSFLQYFHGNSLSLPFENAGNISSVNHLSITLNSVMLYRPSGTLPHANALSFFLSFALPFSIALLFQKNRVLKTLALLSVVLCGIVSILTFSRWGIINIISSLGLMVILLFICKRKFQPIKHIIRISLLLPTTFIVIFIINIDFIRRFFVFSSTDTSLIVRIQLVIQSIYVFQKFPIFGIGGGTFPKFLINYDYSPQQISQFFPAPVHSLFLIILSESGLLVFILFIALMIYFLISFIKNLIKWKLSSKQFESIFIVALFVSSIAYLMNGLWAIRTLDEHLIMLFWMNIGLFFNILRNTNR